MGGFFIEFLDIAKENMRIDLFFAFEIKINGTFAELGFSCDVVNRDMPETLFEKQLPGGVEDHASPLFFFPSPSLLETHDSNLFSFQLKARPTLDHCSLHESKSNTDRRSDTEYTHISALSRKKCNGHEYFFRERSDAFILN
jgi:hypothetical protein